MFKVYILQSQADKSYYIGQCKNIDIRLDQHNFSNRKNSYTRRKRPWVLVYTESYSTRIETVKRERYFKKIKNNKYLEKIIDKKGP